MLELLTMLFIAIIVCGLRWGIMGGIVYFICVIINQPVDFLIAFVLVTLVDILVTIMRGYGSDA